MALLTAASAFDRFQQIMAGRREEERKRSMAAEAFVYQGLLNDILRERQQLRADKHAFEVAHIQGKYNVQQEIIRAAQKRWEQSNEPPEDNWLNAGDKWVNTATGQELPIGEKPGGEGGLTPYQQIQTEERKKKSEIDSIEDQISDLENKIGQYVEGTQSVMEKRSGLLGDWSAKDVEVKKQVLAKQGLIPGEIEGTFKKGYVALPEELEKAYGDSLSTWRADVAKLKERLKQLKEGDSTVGMLEFLDLK